MAYTNFCSENETLKHANSYKQLSWKTQLATNLNLHPALTQILPLHDPHFDHFICNLINNNMYNFQDTCSPCNIRPGPELNT